MSARKLIRALWLVAGFALLLAWQRESILGLIPAARELPRFDGATGKPWIESGFVPAGAHQFLAQGLLPRYIHTASSWVGGDQWQGRAESAWFKANRKIIHVGVAGYPSHAGCRVWAEFRTASGSVHRVEYRLPDPREEWNVWEIWTPSDAVAVRVGAEDRATDLFGWAAISHPYRAWPAAVTASYLLLQVFATTALALILIWGPGVVLAQKCADETQRALVLVGAGPLLLALLGLLVWSCSGFVSPQALGLLLVFGLWSALGAALWRGEVIERLDAFTRRLLAVSALVVIAVVAKSFYSVGPEGELFRGTVSRNFEMTDRIDSRYSFYSVQLAAHHFGPTSKESDQFYFPWTFFSRGPLAGLAAIPLVMATAGEPPAQVPEERWSPFDRGGFAAYRITMITFASTVIMALGLVLLPLVGESWALRAAGLLALSPFAVHEIMFTWPKWIATTWLLLSFALVHARRPFAAGLTLATGYLFHPLVLLWTPWLGLWAAGRAKRDVRGIVVSWAWFGLGAALLVAPWIALGTFMPHSAHTTEPGQAGFFRYWTRADWAIATWSTWWTTRWMNFANTFVPLHVYLADSSFHHPKLSSAYEASGRLIKFGHVWWNTLPFGLGLGLWTVSLGAFWRALRGVPAAAWVLLVSPAVFLVAYWGMDPLGLMRECGHPLFVSVIAITCFVAAREDGWVRTILGHPAVSWLQLPETWLMLWLTTLANPRPWAVNYHQLDAVYFGINALALLGAAWVVSRARRKAVPAEAKLQAAADYLPAT